MAPSPRVTKAFKAMKDIGIPEEKTKPALKKLLRLFNKKMDLIEEENYRLLADTIFEYEDTEIAEKEKKARQAEHVETSMEAADLQDAPMQDEPERPLKRLRQKHQVQAAPSNGQPSPTTGGIALKIPKPEPGEPEASPSQPTQPIGLSPLSRNRRVESQPVLQPHQPLVRNKGKQPVSASNRGVSAGRSEPSADAPARDKRVAAGRPSQALQLKEPKIEPGIAPSEKKKQPQMLIKPKDEPFTDDMISLEPLAVVLPERTDQEVPSNPDIQGGSQDDERTGTPEPVGTGKGTGTSTSTSPSKQQKQLQEIDVPERASANVDLAASPLGEVKISLSCNPSSKGLDFHVPDLQAVLKKVNDNCLKTYNITDPEFSITKVMKEFCDSVVELGSNADAVAQEGFRGRDARVLDSNGINKLPSLNGSLDGEPSHNTAATINGTPTDDSPQPLASSCPQSSMQLDIDVSNDSSAEMDAVVVADMNMKSLVPCDMCDIAKGEEAVKVSLEKSNCEFLPSFRYISRSVVSNSADAYFSLAQIGEEDYCHSCCDDCLLMSASCNCAQRNGGESPYTLDGVLRDEFLDECIALARNPRRPYLLYCKDCPLERSKNEDMLDPCKGHLNRQFIKECGTKCGCSRNCGNRVVQRGIRCNLQVFWTSEGKGWGLRTLEDLPKGSFVCEFVGEILTAVELHKRNLSRSNEKHSYSLLMDTQWGTRTFKEEECLCLDATFYGNASRFINHRCADANLIEIPVEVETPSHHYYHVAFFTTRNVNAFEELTWDYGIDFDDNEHHIKAFSCLCGSQFCRNMKRSSRSRSALIIQ